MSYKDNAYLNANIKESADASKGTLNSIKDEMNRRIGQRFTQELRTTLLQRITVAIKHALETGINLGVQKERENTDQYELALELLASDYKKGAVLKASDAEHLKARYKYKAKKILGASDDERLEDIIELSDKYRMSLSDIKDAIKTGELKANKQRNNIYVDVDEFMKWRKNKRGQEKRKEKAVGKA